MKAKSVVNGLSIHIRKLEKELVKHKVSGRMKIKNRNQRNKNQVTEKLKARGHFFEKINTIDKPLAQ